MQETVQEELADVRALLRARTYIYTLFHKVFGGEPTAELLTALASEATADALAPFAQERGSLRAWASLLGSLSERDLPKLADDLRYEYTRMFMGVGRPEVLPWEGPYVSNEVAFFQESTLMVREAYREQGLVAKMKGHVPDDHISIMCAFQAELGRRALATVAPSEMAQALRAAQRFLGEHMLSWLDKFAYAARRAKTCLLYPQACEAMFEFAKLDAVFLGEAASWAEGLDQDAMIPLDCDDGQCDQDASLAALAKLRLKYLEESEFVSLGVNGDVVV